MTDRRLVHIIDDEEAVRRSAGFMLKTSGFAVCGWESGSAFLKDVRHVEEGCILLDIRMPDMDGLEVQQTLNKRGVTMPVIMLTGHADVTVAVKAMKAGALDFIEKPFGAEVLLAAIERGFDQRDTAAHASTCAAQADIVLGALTPRERQVLGGLAQGLPNKTIAFDLGISARTVEVHRANVMHKLGARSLSDALRIAFAAGLGNEDGKRAD